MNLQELLSQVSPQFAGGSPQAVADMTARFAAGEAARSNKSAKASPTAAAIMQCVTAAACPMFGIFEGDISEQDKLLFTLVLTGACTTLHERDNDGATGCEVEICPDNIRSAVSIYKKLTGKDVVPYLNESLASFLKAASPVN